MLWYSLSADKEMANIPELLREGFFARYTKSCALLPLLPASRLRRRALASVRPNNSGKSRSQLLTLSFVLLVVVVVVVVVPHCFLLSFGPS